MTILLRCLYCVAVVCTVVTNSTQALCTSYSVVAICTVADSNAHQIADSTWVVWRDVTYAGRDAVNLYTSIATMTTNDVLRVGTIVGATGAVFAVAHATDLDTKLRDVAREHQSETARKVFRVGNSFGEIYAIAGAAAGTYLVGLIAGDNEIRTTGRLVFETLIVAGILTTGLKYAIGRARPFMNVGASAYSPFGSSWDDNYFSMPSGHATVAFAMASILSERIENPWATAGLYTLATSTALSRMYFDKHWFTDVVGGAVIGTASGFLLSSLYPSSSEGRRNTSLGEAKAQSPTVRLLPAGLGLQLVVSW